MPVSDTVVSVAETPRGVPVTATGKRPGLPTTRQQASDQAQRSTPELPGQLITFWSRLRNDYAGLLTKCVAG
ncbi:MAG TPA: hypothetical protein VNO83_06450 [Pseudonocardia sp.]|nr:hypothetical protein [Pseudonocardia sp.]